MEFEGVGGVAMGYFRVQVGGQVDDIDGAKGTFFGTDPASYLLTLVTWVILYQYYKLTISQSDGVPESFRDEGDFTRGGNFNTEFPSTYNGA